MYLYTLLFWLIFNEHLSCNRLCNKPWTIKLTLSCNVKEVILLSSRSPQASWLLWQVRCCEKLFTWRSLVWLVYRDLRKKETYKSVVHSTLFIYFSNKFCYWQLCECFPKKMGIFSWGWGWGKGEGASILINSVKNLCMAIYPVSKLLLENGEIQSYRYFL